MTTALFVLNAGLFAGILGLSFLLLGTLRALGVLTWRLDQIEAMRPSRIGREGLKVGQKAPDFTLPEARGGEQSLSSFAGRKVLMVFTQTGCGPCMEIAAELNRLQERGEYQVFVVNNGELGATHEWATKLKARFPVLVQEKFNLSKRYEVFVTPFAFLVDEQGFITSKGLVGSQQYLNYVLTGAGNRKEHEYVETERDSVVEHSSAVSLSSKEMTHV